MCIMLVLVNDFSFLDDTVDHLIQTAQPVDKVLPTIEKGTHHTIYSWALMCERDYLWTLVS